MRASVRSITLSNTNISATSKPIPIKGPLTIWPVYAYTLAAQNTVIKLLMLILSIENNTSISCEAIYAKIFVYFVII